MKGRFTCLLCGRATVPAVVLGDRIFGPRCAKKLGLPQRAAKANPRIRVLARQAPQKADEAQAELFEDCPA